MQSCAKCHSLSSDDATMCSTCGTLLPEGNTVMTALKKFRENHRVVSVRLVVADDACPACKEASATFKKEDAPTLPHITCSHEGGCRCFYEPMLDEIYP